MHKLKKLISACVLTLTAALLGGCQTTSKVQDLVYVNNFFKVTVPAGWRVVSSDGPDLPARLTLQSNDYQAYVTLRVMHTDMTAGELCNMAAKGFVSNGAELQLGPEVRFGTCIIQADAAAHPAVLWLRVYEDGSLYAINFTGEQEKVNEVLSRIEGDDRLMQLFVMPL